jgi:hypothetical protein
MACRKTRCNDIVEAIRNKIGFDTSAVEIDRRLSHVSSRLLETPLDQNLSEQLALSLPLVFASY